MLSIGMVISGCTDQPQQVDKQSIVLDSINE
jgi:hypothetical protein